MRYGLAIEVQSGTRVTQAVQPFETQELDIEGQLLCMTKGNQPEMGHASAGEGCTLADRGAWETRAIAVDDVRMKGP